MDLEEKKRILTRLQLRMLKFMDLFMYSQTVQEKLPTEIQGNKFDAIGDYLIPQIKPVIHMANLKSKFLKIQAIKSTSPHE